MTKPLPITQSLHAWMDVFMHRSMRGWMHFAKSTGLSMPQFSILMQLHHRGACGMSTISERFDVSPAGASQLVEKLVQGKYIERTEDPSDRRAKLIQITPKGLELVQTGLAERHRWMDELVSKLTTEDKAKVTEALNILTESARRLDETS